MGRHVSALLIGAGHEVVVLSRHAGRPARPGMSYALFDAAGQRCDAGAIAALDGVIHLAGEPIAGKRWTASQKAAIRDSRVNGTKYLVAQLRQHARRCKVLVAASATGYYGADGGSQPFNEDAPPGDDFLAQVCVAWEEASCAAQDMMRVVCLRTGIVLSREGGAWPELTKALRLRVLPIPGNGRQVVSWVHVADLARLYVAAIGDAGMSGPYNAVAPEPVTYNELMACVARVRGGWHFMPHIPAIALRAALGEMSVELLKSCTVSAGNVLRSGFVYQCPDIRSAVHRLLGATPPPAA